MARGESNDNSDSSWPTHFELLIFRLQELARQSKAHVAWLKAYRRRNISCGSITPVQRTYSEAGQEDDTRESPEMEELVPKLAAVRKEVSMLFKAMRARVRNRVGNRART